MIRFIILCYLLTPIAMLTVSDTNGRTDPEETRPARGKSLSIDYVNLPTEKCESILLDGDNSEDEACSDYCKNLKKGFFDGECLNGICNCKFNISTIVDPPVDNTRVKGKTGKMKGRQRVKCKNLIRVRGQTGSENHKGCGIHCRLMDTENKDGRCINGVCHCSREIIEERRKITEEDEDEEEEVEEVVARCGSSEDCESECSGPNREPRCTGGICRCRILPVLPESLEIPAIEREAKKCEHRRKTVSDEICRSHCQDFSRDHTEGRCVEGICQCGYAVFEIAEVDENGANKSSSATKKKRRGRNKTTN